MIIHWVSTVPSGKAHTHGADSGNTGWKLHAIQTESDNPSTEQVKSLRAMCGLKPKYGWGVDLFIESRCSRCESYLPPDQRSKLYGK